jgi:hypothetical protein
LETDFGFDDDSHAEAIYCLQTSEELPLNCRTDEGTVAESIAEEHKGIGVTFAPDVADQYPSLRYLAPGNPLFVWLSKKLIGDGDNRMLSMRAFGYDTNQSVTESLQKPWLVCSWTRGKDSNSLVTLTNNGQVTESEDSVDDLATWAQRFVSNRTNVLD